MAQIGISLAGVEAAVPFGIVPAGEYNVKIVRSEVKALNSGNGHALNLELEILDGEFNGRKLFDSLNLWHTANETTVKVAFGALAAIAKAVGVGPDIPDSEILHDKPLRATVRVEKGNAEYPDDKNRVKGYSEYKAPTASAPSAPMAPAFVPPPVTRAPAAPAFAPAAPAAPAFQPPVPQAAPVEPPPFAPVAPVAPTAPAPMAPPMAPPPAFAPAAPMAPAAPGMFPGAPAGAPAPFQWQQQS